MRRRVISLWAWVLAACLCGFVSGAQGTACSGHRVHHYLFDAGLNRSWAILEDCAHPGAPWTALELGGEEKKAVISSPLPHSSMPGRTLPEILAGASVRLWRRSGTALINLNGVALENGIQGTSIRVRLDLTANASGKVLRGIVRGPGSVELGSPAPDAGDGARWRATR